MGKVVGDAYPQKDKKTELNCFSTSFEIDWSSVKPAQEITDIKWIKKMKQKTLHLPCLHGLNMLKKRGV